MSARSVNPLAPHSTLSRRKFVRGVAAVGGAAAALGSKPWTSNLVADGHEDGDRQDDERSCSLCAAPFPIPHLTPTPVGESYHFFFPGPVEGTTAPTDPTGPHTGTGRDPSVIWDFKGFVGSADVNLSGTGTTATGNAPYTFHADMRFMKGQWVGTDGKVHHGALAFI